MAASSLLPVELRRVNHAASTNAAQFNRCAGGPGGAVAHGTKTGRPARSKAYNGPAMPMDSSTPFDRLAERVERLLVRHEQLERTNALLSSQVAALTQERDSLRSRLQAARARVDALIERLPSPPMEKDTP